MIMNLPRLRAEKILDENVSLEDPDQAWRVVRLATGSEHEANKVRSSILERMRQRDER
jgi:hypothetical protein